eukprot:tig00021293_g20007.t1
MSGRRSESRLLESPAGVRRIVANYRCSSYLNLSFTVPVVVASVVVLARTWETACDQRLQLWLLILVAEQAATLPLRWWIHRSLPAVHGEFSMLFAINRLRHIQMSVPFRASRILRFTLMAWGIVGCALVFESKTCRETSPHLYTLCFALCLIFLVVVSLLLLYSCCYVSCLCTARALTRWHRRVNLTSLELAARPGLGPLATPTGTPQSDIDSLPTLLYRAEGGLEGGLLGGPWKVDTQCAICLCEYEAGEELRVLPCRHSFHDACIVPWLQRSTCCPLCKKSLVPGAPEEEPPRPVVMRTSAGAAAEGRAGPPAPVEGERPAGRAEDAAVEAAVGEVAAAAAAAAEGLWGTRRPRPRGRPRAEEGEEAPAARGGAEEEGERVEPLAERAAAPAPARLEGRAPRSRRGQPRSCWRPTGRGGFHRQPRARAGGDPPGAAEAERPLPQSPHVPEAAEPGRGAEPAAERGTSPRQGPARAIDFDAIRGSLTPDPRRFFGYGALASLALDVFTFPLSLVKTRLQTQRSLDPRTSTRTIYTGTGHAFRTILKQEGLRGFYCGFWAAALGGFPTAAVYFSSYEVSKYVADGSAALEGVAQPVRHLACGAIAELVADVFWVPVDSISKRMQTQGLEKRYTGAVDCFRKVVAQHGPVALWAGLPATILTNVPFSAVWWAAYEYSKRSLHELDARSQFRARFFGPRTPPTRPFAARNGAAPAPEAASDQDPLFHVASGVFAGTVAAVTTNPLDVCKTRLVSGQGLGEGAGARRAGAPSFQETFDLLRRIVREEGARALLKGMAPRVMYTAPASALTFGFYEQVKKYSAKD